MLPERHSAFEDAPFTELLAILLRQLRRPLASQGVTISDADADALAQAIAARAEPDSTVEAIHAALLALVADSEAVLAQWNLTFAQSLDAQMNDIPGWESTAEFLDIANEKANAELRISTGAALLVALGDPRYVPLLRLLVERASDGNVADPDDIIARRVLAFAEHDPSP